MAKKDEKAIEEQQPEQVLSKNEEQKAQDAQHVENEQVSQETEQQEQTGQKPVELPKEKETEEKEQTAQEQEKPTSQFLPFHELTAKYRMPTWQSAAVLKLLDKEDDAYFTEQEFLQAVEKLYNRKMGA